MKIKTLLPRKGFITLILKEEDKYLVSCDYEMTNWDKNHPERYIMDQKMMSVSTIEKLTGVKL